MHQPFVKVCVKCTLTTVWLSFFLNIHLNLYSNYKKVLLFSLMPIGDIACRPSEYVAIFIVRVASTTQGPTEHVTIFLVRVSLYHKGLLNMSQHLI